MPASSIAPKEPTTEIAKALAHQAVEVFGNGELAALPSIVAEDYLNHEGFPGMSPGRRGLEEVVQMVRQGFPDFRYTVERTVAEGDQVVVHVTATGTHTGVLFHTFEPTGRSATWSEMHWFRVQDGLLAEHWGCRDDAGMFRQLGLT